MTNMTNITSEMQEAADLVNGDRQEAYGCAYKEAKRLAAMFSAVLDFEVPVRKVPLLLMCLKISREANAPKRDNLVDLHGYCLVHKRVLEGMAADVSEKDKIKHVLSTKQVTQQPLTAQQFIDKHTHILGDK